MATTTTRRLLPVAALLVGLLLLPACDNQSQEEIAQLRASLQSWEAKYQTLSADKAQADQQAADQKAKADALSAERDDLKAKLAAAESQVKQLKDQVTKLTEAAAAPRPAAATTAAPPSADLAKVLARLEGVAGDLYRDDNYNAVNAVLLSACDLGSKNPLTFYRLGYVAASAGSYADALGWYEKSLAALAQQPTPDPDLQAQCLNNYAVALSKTGKVPEAIAAYLKALGINSSYTPPLYNVALLYARSAADKDKAIDALRRYIASGGARSVSARNMLQELLPAPGPPAPAAAPAAGAPAK
jgi:tetratricopeptide (TPR) repeat protein